MSKILIRILTSKVQEAIKTIYEIMEANIINLFGFTFKDSIFK